MNDVDAAIAALVSDLHWQIDQMPRRGIKNSAGNPYIPSYYKRALERAIGRGGMAVAHYVRSYLYKQPSEGYKKLEDADSLDLACEALVADERKPYAALFTDADRQAARQRLAPHIQAIERRKGARRDRIAARHSALPEDLDALRELAMTSASLEDAIAVNEAILSQVPDDIPALNRLGRAHADAGAFEEATKRFEAVLAIDPNNGVATRRLREIAARRGRRWARSR